MKYILIFWLVFVLFKLLKFLFGHHHLTGYTKQGLPIYPVGKTDNYYRHFGFIDKEMYYPNFFESDTKEMLCDGEHQKIYKCPECGKNFVEHTKIL